MLSDITNVAVTENFTESLLTGNCYDNACAESFFSSLKKDLIYGTHFRTREEAKEAIIGYIEGFYNSRRLHSALGYKSPREYINEYDMI